MLSFCAVGYVEGQKAATTMRAVVRCPGKPKSAKKQSKAFLFVAIHKDQVALL